MGREPGQIRRLQNYIAAPGTPIERAIFVPPAFPLLMDAITNWETYLHADEKDPSSSSLYSRRNSS